MEVHAETEARCVLLYFSAAWFWCYPFHFGKRAALSLDLVMLRLACLTFCIPVIRMKNAFEIYWESGCMKAFQCFELISPLCRSVESFGNKVQILQERQDQNCGSGRCRILSPCPHSINSLGRINQDCFSSLQKWNKKRMLLISLHPPTPEV